MRVVVKYQYYDKNYIIITLPLINMLGRGSDYREVIKCYEKLVYW